jgi:hypothetical protein
MFTCQMSLNRTRTGERSGLDRSWVTCGRVWKAVLAWVDGYSTRKGLSESGAGAPHSKTWRSSHGAFGWAQALWPTLGLDFGATLSTIPAA